MQNQSEQQIGTRSDYDSARSEIGNKLEEGKQAATEAFHDARDEVTRKAGEYAEQAKDTLVEKAEGAQRNVSANLKAFSGALRAASEHLANGDQKSISKLVLDAAGGLERLSSSITNKPVEELLGDLRQFGRDNSGALVAGSVLAGLALGRFIKSSNPEGSAGFARSSGETAPWREHTAGSSDPAEGWPKPHGGQIDE